MKRLAILLSFIILFSTPFQSFATTSNEDNINEKEVLRLKKMFDISDDYKNLDFSTQTDPQGSKYYFYSWSSDNDSLYISVGKDGNIIDYSNYVDSSTKPVSLKNKADIENKIHEFLNKIDSEILKNYKLADFNINIKNGFANFTYSRYVDDILVINDSISISVDLRNQKVSNYSKSNASSIFKDGSFPKKSDAISIEKAKEILNKEQPLILCYKIVDEYTSPKAIPVYTQLPPNRPIDALSGHLIKDSIYNIPYADARSMGGDFMEIAEDSSSLTEVEKTELDTIKGLASTEEAKKEISSKLDLSNFKFISIDLGKYRSENYTYYLRYSSEDEKSEINVSIDAKNLEILNYNSYGNFPIAKSKELPEEEATKLAQDFVKKMSKRLNSINFENPVVNSNEYQTEVYFPRMENTYNVIGNGINISIDNSNKKIVNYNVNFSNVKFENITEDIGAKKATESALNSLEFKKYYAYVGDSPKLTYTFKDNISPVVSAKDGTILNEFGKEKKDSEIIYENIDKSKYKDEINYLISLNIGVPTVKDLNSKIKVGDFIYLLDSISYKNPYEIEYIKSLVSSNIYEQLKEEDIEKNTLNKLAVRWILNSENYSNLNDAKNVFDKSIFTDSSSISKEDLAYFYLAYSLSLYDSKEAKPNEEITHEDALHLIYNLLK